MKTIAVLAALAAVAVAVPAPPGYSYDRYRSVQHRLPATIRREKKSPQLENLEFGPVAPVEDEAIRGDIDTSARTIGLKKPIIVKKKYGYHLYRDSDEEQAQADSQEKCTKEVKVKLCDAENFAHMRSAAEDTSAQISENDMKNSIKLAKEAVENLQKMTQFKNVEMGPDAELHGDIEVARQALEHIQQNFGNLEEMNLQATTLTEVEALEKARFTIAKTDDEKMAQWKEAIDNIQKNAELAKNIEDSFKSANPSNLATSGHAEPIKKANIESVIVAEDFHKPLMEPKSIDEKAAEAESLIKENTEENLHALHEMVSSASEHKEVKSALDDSPAKAEEGTLKVENIKIETDAEKISPLHTEQGKSTEFDASLHAPVASVQQKSVDLHDSEKAAKTDNKIADKTVESKASENMEMMSDLTSAQSAPVMKIVPLSELNALPAEHVLLNNADAHLTEQKSSWMETQDKKMLAKSTENDHVADAVKIVDQSKMEHEKAAVIDTTTLMKSAESTPNHLTEAMEVKMEGKEAKQWIKAAESPANTNDHAMNENHDRISQLKSADLVLPPRSELASTHMGPNMPINHEMASEMRAVEPNNMQQHMNDQFEFKTEGKNWHADDMNSMAGKTLHDDEFERDAPFVHGHEAHQFGPHSQFGQQSHHHQFRPEMNHHHHHHSQSFQDPHHGFHGKAADADNAVQASINVNVNDVAGKAAMERNMQWKQKEGAARGAYGAGAYGVAGGAGLNLAAGAASGPGAVGVFPGASVGGCAIPLLLSCSPSVVPGSLAKAPAYGGHAYRSGGDFDNRFHNKRDTKKNIDKISTKVKRTPAKVIQKIPFDKKL